MLQALSDALWRPWLLCLFLLTGLWCSLSSGFFQLFGLRFWLRESLGALRSGKTGKGEGGLPPFQALCTALASTMGTGSIAGVATAITLGGAGAVLWMWVGALLGMMTGYVEKYLALRYRRPGPTGWEGGPMEYLTHLGWHRASRWFALWCALSSLTGGALVQTNSMISCLPGLSTSVRWWVGVLIALTVALVMAGGLKGLGRLSQALVPAMAALYLTAGVAVICHNAAALPSALTSILRGALSPQAIAGGAAGTALRYGVARGVFTNEAGMGTSAMVHAAAGGTTPHREGCRGIFECGFATLVVCSVTALAILTAAPLSDAAGAGLVGLAFSSFLGPWGGPVVGLCLALFAFTSLLGWEYYGQRSVAHLTGRAHPKAFRLCYLCAILAGAVGDVEGVWALNDLCTGLMALPNLLAILYLSREALPVRLDRPQRSVIQ